MISYYKRELKRKNKKKTHTYNINHKPPSSVISTHKMTLFPDSGPTNHLCFFLFFSCMPENTQKNSAHIPKSIKPQLEVEKPSPSRSKKNFKDALRPVYWPSVIPHESWGLLLAVAHCIQIVKIYLQKLWFCHSHIVL